MRTPRSFGLVATACLALGLGVGIGSSTVLEQFASSRGPSHNYVQQWDASNAGNHDAVPGPTTPTTAGGPAQGQRLDDARTADGDDKRKLSRRERLWVKWVTYFATCECTRTPDDPEGSAEGRTRDERVWATPHASTSFVAPVPPVVTVAAPAVPSFTDPPRTERPVRRVDKKKAPKADPKDPDKPHHPPEEPHDPPDVTPERPDIRELQADLRELQSLAHAVRDRIHQARSLARADRVRDAIAHEGAGGATHDWHDTAGASPADQTRHGRGRHSGAGVPHVPAPNDPSEAEREASGSRAPSPAD
jgi:hypothetical protein